MPWPFTVNIALDCVPGGMTSGKRGLFVVGLEGRHADLGAERRVGQRRRARG